MPAMGGLTQEEVERIMGQELAEGPGIVMHGTMDEPIQGMRAIIAQQQEQKAEDRIRNVLDDKEYDKYLQEKSVSGFSPTENIALERLSRVDERLARLAEKKRPKTGWEAEKERIIQTSYGGEDPFTVDLQDLKKKAGQEAGKALKSKLLKAMEITEQDLDTEARVKLLLATEQESTRIAEDLEAEYSDRMNRIERARDDYRAEEQIRAKQAEPSWMQKTLFKEGLIRGRPEKVQKPSPVTWTTATKQLSRRFGKEDPMGNIIITPELAGMNRIAQQKLVELKKQNMEPLESINIAENFARHIDNRYWEWIDAPKRSKEEIKDFNKQFKARYGYIPRIRPR